MREDFTGGRNMIRKGNVWEILNNYNWYYILGKDNNKFYIFILCNGF